LPASVADCFAAGLTRYQAGEPAVAALLFAAVLAVVPDDPDVLRLRGLALARAGDATAALPLLARANRLAPHNTLATLHHGIGLLEAGQPARAAARFRRATMLDPTSAAPWINFAAALLALGRPPAARAAARRAMRLAPHAAEPLLMLGRGEAAAGDFAAARVAFAEAVRRDPAQVEGWIDLALVQCRLGDIGAAMTAMQKALAARPGHSAAEANLAAFEILRGDQEAALARLRAVLARDPGCVPARLNLANALLLDQEAEPALALLAGPPPAGREGAHWRAHRALALILLRRADAAARDLDAIPAPWGDAELLILGRRLRLAAGSGDAPAADDLAERAEALAGQAGSALYEHRVTTHFELARFHHQQGRRERAFALWTRGHHLMQHVQPFSRARHAAFVTAGIEAYDAARLRDGPCADNDDPAPVFIVGLPRSGTSLTEQIIAAHAQVHGAAERPAVHRLLTRLGGEPLEAGAVRRLATLDAAVLTTAARDFLTDLHAEAPAARLITDKMPANALHLGAIATLLPRARVILCRRDPRDVGLSIFQLRFFGYHPYAHDLADLGWYIGQHERLMRHWRAVLPLPMLEIELADWVTDFAGTLARVLDFLGLPYDPACEHFHRSRRRVRTASAAQIREPINARGLGRWRAFAEPLAPMIAELADAGLLPQAPPDAPSDGALDSPADSPAVAPSDVAAP
jgi:tetratricopeptide (TPR) repeat protein